MNKMHSVVDLDILFPTRSFTLELLTGSTDLFLRTLVVISCLYKSDYFLAVLERDLEGSLTLGFQPSVPPRTFFTVNSRA